MFFHHYIKKMAKIIRHTENYRNFVLRISLMFTNGIGGKKLYSTDGLLLVDGNLNGSSAKG